MTAAQMERKRPAHAGGLGSPCNLAVYPIFRCVHPITSTSAARRKRRKSSPLSFPLSWLLLLALLAVCMAATGANVVASSIANNQSRRSPWPNLLQPNLLFLWSNLLLWPTKLNLWPSKLNLA